MVDFFAKTDSTSENGYVWLANTIKNSFAINCKLPSSTKVFFITGTYATLNQSDLSVTISEV